MTDPRLEAAANAYAATVGGAYNQSKNEWYRHAAIILAAADAASGERSTTEESARALEAATAPDPRPRLPELRIDDGFEV